MNTLKRNHRSVIALTALAVAVTFRALNLPAHADQAPEIRWFFLSDDNRPEQISCTMTFDGERFPCQSAAVGRQGGEVIWFVVSQVDRPGISTNSLQFITGRQGVDVANRRLEFQIIGAIFSGPGGSNTRTFENGSGRCILDVSDPHYGIVYQSCTFTLTNSGQTISSEASYISIKGDFGPD